MPEEARRLLLHAGSIAAGPLEDPGKAAELFAKALPLGPSDPEVWVRLGRLYAGPLHDPDHAARCFARAYAADHDRADLLLSLADFHHDTGEWEPANDYYAEALKRDAVPSEDLQRV